MALCPLYMNHQGAFTHTAIVSLPADTVFREDFTFGTIGPNNIISGLAHLCPMVAHFSRPILRDSDDSEYRMRGIIGNGLSRGGGLRTNALLEGGGQRTPTPCLPILGLDCFLQRPTFLPFHFSAVYLFAFSAFCLFFLFCLPTFGVHPSCEPFAGGNVSTTRVFLILRYYDEWKTILAAVVMLQSSVICLAHAKKTTILPLVFVQAINWENSLINTVLVFICTAPRYSSAQCLLNLYKTQYDVNT